MPCVPTDANENGNRTNLPWIIETRGKDANQGHGLHYATSLLHGLGLSNCWTMISDRIRIRWVCVQMLKSATPDE